MSTEQPARDVLLTARGPNASVLAFAVTALVVGALVHVWTIWFSTDQQLLVSAATFATACGAIVAVAARIRHRVGALLALMSGCVALIAVTASEWTCAAVTYALGGHCFQRVGYWVLAEHHWVWFPIAVSSLAATLTPVLLVAQSARRKPTIDARARVAFGLGACLVVAAAVGALLSVASLASLLALTIVGALMLGASLLDARRRAHALSGLADDRESYVTPAQEDDPVDLPSLAIFPSRLSLGVVRVDEPVRRDAYRAPRLRVAVARCPVDVRAAAQCLNRQVRVRWAWLVASLLVAVLIDQADRTLRSREVAPIIIELH